MSHNLLFLLNDGAYNEVENICLNHPFIPGAQPTSAKQTNKQTKGR